MTDMSARRLRREFIELSKNPIDNIVAVPLETNLLEWHYVITGTKGTPYEGGHYHGLLRFPAEYPLKPPSIMMYTPNGRFSTGRRLCLSNSDFHPETWNPVWGVSTILMGLYSFMLDSASTLGSISSSSAAKRRFAEESLAFNVKDTNFCNLFPDLVELHKTKEEARARDRAAGIDTQSVSPNASVGTAESNLYAARRQDEPGGLILAVCLALIVGMLALLLRIG